MLSDGSQQKATIVGTDQYADLAVLKTDGTGASRCQPWEIQMFSILARQ